MKTRVAVSEMNIGSAKGARSVPEAWECVLEPKMFVRRRRSHTGGRDKLGSASNLHNMDDKLRQ